MADRAFQLITSPDALAALCERLHRADAIALDTEFIREKTYYPQLCLVQVAAPGEVAVIDALALANLAPLHAVLADTGVLKVLHAARQDLEIFAHRMGEVPAPIFDTQIAASLLGHGDQAGYAAVAQAIVGASIDKGLARTDWAARPLADAALAYAADDVRYLLEVYAKLRAELVARGRLEWLVPQFAELSRLDNYRVDPDAVWQRIRGTQRLKPRERALLARLAAWRERVAIAADRPRGWILKDEALLDVARRAPADVEQLARIRDVPEGFVKRRGAELVALVAETRDAALEAADGRERLTADQESLIDLMMALARARAGEHSVSASNLAPRRELERLVRGDRDLELLKGWRHAALGAELIELLEGRLAVRVAGGRILVERT